jgi:hypothetical protein
MRVLSKPMNEATLESARQAKAKLNSILDGVGNVVGIGITRVGVGFGVKVNLSDGADAALVPSEVEGVPVIVEVTGRITKQA